MPLCPPSEFWRGLETAALDTSLSRYQLYKTHRDTLPDLVIEQFRLFLARTTLLHGKALGCGDLVQFQSQNDSDRYKFGVVSTVDESDLSCHIQIESADGEIVQIQQERIRFISLEEAETMLAVVKDVMLKLPRSQIFSAARPMLHKHQDKIFEAKETLATQINDIAANSSLDRLVSQLERSHISHDRKSLNIVDGYIRTCLEQLRQQAESSVNITKTIRSLMETIPVWTRYFAIFSTRRDDYAVVLKYAVQHVFQVIESFEDTSGDTLRRLCGKVDEFTAILDLMRQKPAAAVARTGAGETSIYSCLSTKDSAWDSRVRKAFQVLAQRLLRSSQDAVDNISSLKSAVAAVRNKTVHKLAFDVVFRAILSSLTSLEQSESGLMQLQRYCSGWTENETALRLSQLPPFRQHYTALRDIQDECSARLRTPNYWNEALGTTTPNPGDHDSFYCGLNVCLKIFNFCKRLVRDDSSGREFDAEVASSDSNYVEKDWDAVAHIQEQVDDNFYINAKTDLEQGNFSQFSILADNIRSIHDNFDDPQLKRSAKSKLDALEHLFDTSLSAMQDNYRMTPESWVKWTASIDFVGAGLALIKRIGAEVDMFKKVVFRKIEELLISYEQGPNGGQFIGELVVALEKNCGSYGVLVVSEHPVFATYRYYWMNQRFSSLTIEKLLVDVKGIDFEKLAIKRAYDSIILEYDCLVKTGKMNRTFVDELPGNLKTILATSSVDLNVKVQKAIAYVTATWSLSNLAGYDMLTKLKSAEFSNADFSIKKPHTGQVVAILRLLGCDGFALLPRTADYSTGSVSGGGSRGKSCLKNLPKLSDGGVSTPSASTGLLRSIYGGAVDAISYVGSFISPTRPKAFTPTKAAGLSLDNHFVELATGEGEDLAK